MGCWDGLFWLRAGGNPGANAPTTHSTAGANTFINIYPLTKFWKKKKPNPDSLC